MKAFVFACLAVAATLFARPAAAASQSEPERAHAGTTAAFPTAPLPLVRFLMNALELPDQQVLAVENALKARPLKTSSPDELASILRPALQEEMFARLQALQAARAAQLREDLRYLVALR